jgi:hypothetical protein
MFTYPAFLGMKPLVMKEAALEHFFNPKQYRIFITKFDYIICTNLLLYTVLYCNEIRFAIV